MAEEKIGKFNLIDTLYALDAAIAMSKMKSFHPDTYRYFQIVIPLYVKDEIERFMNGQIKIGTYRSLDKYRGYPIITGYENKIILHHLDYPLYQEEWMYYEVELK